MTSPRDFLLHLDGVFGPQTYTFQLLSKQWGSDGENAVGEDRSPIFQATTDTLAAEVLKRCDATYVNLYISAGVFSEGRRWENCTKPLWILCDFDAAHYFAHTTNTDKATMEQQLHYNCDNLAAALDEHAKFLNGRAKELELVPSRWIRSGYGHYGLYYLDCDPVEELRELSYRLHAEWNKEFTLTDHTKDPGTRLMRMIGFWNVKVPNNPQQCIAFKGNDHLWTLDELRDRLPEVRDTEPSKADSDKPWQRLLSRKCLAYIAGDLPREGERNNTLFNFACECQAAGIDERDALDLLYDPAYKAGLDRREIENTVRSAFSRDREPAKSVTHDITDDTKHEDLSLELRVLACALKDVQSRHAVVDHLDEYDFASRINRAIYKAIKEAHENGDVDIMLVHDMLQAHSHDEACLRVLELAKMASNPEALDENVAQVRMASTDRRLLRCCTDYIDDVAKPHDTTLADRLWLEVQNIMNRRQPKPLRTFSEVATEVYHEAEKASVEIKALKDTDEEKPLKGLPTGIHELDELTGGLRRGTCSVICGYTGDGKTSAATQIMTNMAKRGHNVAYISLELSEQQIVSKIMASNIGVSMRELERGDLNDDMWLELGTIIEDKSGSRLYIYDGARTLSEIQAVVSTAALEYGVEFFVIDFIQLVSVPYSKGNTVADLGIILRALVGQQAKLNTHMMWVSQLSRAPKDRKKPVPTLKDLRGSGELEQLVRLAMYVYRDPEHEHDPKVTDDAAEFGVIKSNFSPCAVWNCWFSRIRQRFEEMKDKV